MGKPPAFQFYAADFLVDTAAMSPEQLGVYIRLLCNSWVNRGIPSEPRQIARIAGVSERKLNALWPALKGRWESDGNGGLVNPRLETVRAERDEWSKKSREGGLASAAKRQAA